MKVLETVALRWYRYHQYLTGWLYLLLKVNRWFLMAVFSASSSITTRCAFECSRRRQRSLASCQLCRSNITAWRLVVPGKLCMKLIITHRAIVSSSLSSLTIINHTAAAAAEVRRNDDDVALVSARFGKWDRRSLRSSNAEAHTLLQWGHCGPVLGFMDATRRLACRFSEALIQLFLSLSSPSSQIALHSSLSAAAASRSDKSMLHFSRIDLTSIQSYRNMKTNTKKVHNITTGRTDHLSTKNSVNLKNRQTSKICQVVKTFSSYNCEL